MPRSKKQVIADLRKLAARGVEMCTSGLVEADSVLFAQARHVFGSQAAAIWHWKATLNQFAIAFEGRLA